MDVVRFGLWLSVLTALLALLNSEVAADAGMHFDEAKRVILPAEAATTILKWYVADGNGVAEEWPVRSGDLDHLEVALATALAKANFGRPLQSLYRQYMPARWNGLRLIVVNGFDDTMLDFEKQLDKNADLTQWKRKLVVSFGGGCLQWRAVYIVEQNRFMVLNNLGHHATVLCNAPK
jgi:hypothetical protein